MIPGSANPLLLTSADSGYAIERSLRFNSGDSAYLNRTPSAAGNRKTWTWSGWVKKARVGEEGNLFTVGASSTDAKFRFNGNDTLEVSDGGGGQLTTAAVFRDTSAWYHIVVLLDNTQATAANRFKLYINGSEAVVTGSPSSQNTDGAFNTAVAHYIGRQVHNTANLFNGYLAEINFIDGSALDPTSFGAFDNNGVWQPKKFAGTYGTNGFHLDFADNSSNAALGTDTSGNNNTCTVNNLSVAAGAGNDSLVDSPTNVTQTDTGAGGEVVGNYATLNPLDKSSSLTLSNGNLEADTTGGWDSVRATFGMSSGKWYWETQNKQTAGALIGIALSTAAHGALGTAADGAWTWAGANVYINGTSSGTGLSNHSSTDIVQYALDVDAGKLWFGRNGTWYDSSWGTTGNPSTGANPTVSGLSTTSTYFAAAALVGAGAIYNFGQRAFAYTAPSGYKSLNTANLPDPTIADGSKYFDVRSGLTAQFTISDLNFATGLMAAKSTSNDEYWIVADVVRNNFVGPLRFNDTNAEGNGAAITNVSATGYQSDSNWFTNGRTYATFNWDGGTSTVTNNDGSIASQVRAQPSAGFSIVKYQADAPNNTIGHGLNAVPELVIIKSTTRTDNWIVYHSAIGLTGWLHLNATHATTNASIWGTSGNWTSDTFGVSTSAIEGNNYGSNDYIAYCFAPVSGYSSMGSFVGNGSSDGIFVSTNFRPSFILIKASSISGEDWVILDTARAPSNVSSLLIKPNTSEQEFTNSAYNTDILSNGFKIRNSNPRFNQSGATYIYYAVAENPFQANGGLAR